ncbi:MAG TPA: DUF2975 domain-containing protein [Allosphingosinicella sp.]
MLKPHPTALGASRFLLKLLMIFNLLVGVGLILAVPASYVFDAEFLAFFSKRPARIDPTWILPAFRIWVLLALPMVAAVHIMFSRLLEVVATVGAGDPFVAENAVRLKTIAWCMLAVQLLGLSFGVMVGIFNAAGSNMDWDFSLTGWLAVALTFVLARVFEVGTRMRAELATMI